MLAEENLKVKLANIDKRNVTGESCGMQKRGNYAENS